MNIDQSISRRDLLNSLASASAAALATDFAPQMAIAGSEPIQPTADSVILLWMAGGMAQTETFDPKHYEPFHTGIESKRVLSTFPAINTSVDGVQISEGLEEIASVMHEGTIVRSLTLPVVSKIVHSRHQYHFHTGYLPPLSVAAPHIGSVMARTLGSRNPDMPAFVSVGETFAEAGREAKAIRSFLSSGFLGSQYNPLLIPQPEKAPELFRSTVGPLRGENRMKRFREMVAASPAGHLGSSYQQESLLRSYDEAWQLMNSPSASAFDVALERDSVQKKYNTGSFGLGCLLARRLVEAGTRFVEVHIPYKPFGYWDTHENGHNRTVELKKMIDRPVAQLIRDLRERNLLDRTLVILASEFGRDVLIEGKDEKRTIRSSGAFGDTMPDRRHYGMHTHFADAGSVVLFGGGIKKGAVYGSTAEEHPCKTIENPVSMEDLHATIYRAVGIACDLAYEIERRPFYVTRDGEGKAIMDLFA